MTSKSRDQAAEEYLYNTYEDYGCAARDDSEQAFKAGWDAAIKFTQADQTGLDRIKNWEHRPTTDLGPIPEDLRDPMRGTICNPVTVSGLPTTDGPLKVESED